MAGDPPPQIHFWTTPLWKFLFIKLSGILTTPRRWLWIPLGHTRKEHLDALSHSSVHSINNSDSFLVISKADSSCFCDVAFARFAFLFLQCLKRNQCSHVTYLFKTGIRQRKRISTAPQDKFWTDVRYIPWKASEPNVHVLFLPFLRHVPGILDVLDGWEIVCSLMTEVTS
jgi:hypothetical protein